MNTLAKNSWRMRAIGAGLLFVLMIAVNAEPRSVTQSATQSNSYGQNPNQNAGSNQDLKGLKQIDNTTSQGGPVNVINGFRPDDTNSSKRPSSKERHKNVSKLSDKVETLTLNIHGDEYSCKARGSKVVCTSPKKSKIKVSCPPNDNNFICKSFEKIKKIETHP